ncbi:uncharacterized protein CDAR_416081 [Caerostris darwini]|uniref:Uncharacterized protein n=1 Tax=Caerostris darwini TaxID=1538125 RepID=A0AAV4ULM5_9ARAC|nr:uncharacterized protein CDAR_416081 [Caerostris darwini]
MTEFIHEYSNIHEFAADIESALSLQVLFLCFSNFTEVFAVFSTTLRYYDYWADIYGIEKAIFTTSNLISFFGITYFASEVSREDKRLRAIIKEIEFKLSSSKETQNQGNILHKFIESKESIVFSAWGVFHFTRELLLTSTGVFMTYNLLVIQLNTEENDLSSN